MSRINSVKMYGYLLIRVTIFLIRSSYLVPAVMLLGLGNTVVNKTKHRVLITKYLMISVSE